MTPFSINLLISKLTMTSSVLLSLTFVPYSEWAPRHLQIQFSHLGQPQESLDRRLFPPNVPNLTFCVNYAYLLSGPARKRTTLWSLVRLKSPIVVI